MSGFPGAGGNSRGPGNGYDVGPGDGRPYGTPSSASAAPSASSSNVPAWAVVVLVGGSGLAVVCMWLCVLCICRKLRARRRCAVVRDLEAQQSERDTARMLREGDAKEVENQAKPCKVDVGVQMTFVVMAGEDQPSYLACPAIPMPSMVPQEFEGKEQQQSTTSCPLPSNFSRTPTLNPKPSS